MHYVGISTYQFIPYYASIIHKHTRILKPFEHSEPTGLKVAIAVTLENRAQKLRESQGGRPGLPVPNSPYAHSVRKVTLENRAQKLCGSRGDRPGLPVPNSPYVCVVVKHH